MGHGPLFIILVFLLVFLKGMPQEDGIVHRDAQLQDRGNRLGNIGNLSEEIVAPHVVEDGHSNRQKEEDRSKKRIHGKHQDDKGQCHGDADVNRLLLFRQVLRIDDDGRHACQEAVLVRDAADIRGSLHRGIRRCRRIIDDEHQRGAIFEKGILHLLRKRIDRNRKICDAVVPVHILDMINRQDFLFQGFDILIFHAVHDHHGNGPCPELILQDILSLHRLDIRRQICQHIVIDAGIRHAPDRRENEYGSYN